MALDSVPSYPSDLGSSSSRATRTQQRIRKEERTWTADTYAPYDDGHQWRKYGEKKLSNSNFPRDLHSGNLVQQKDMSDPPLFTVTYFNHHSCNTTSRPIGSAPDSTEQSSSRRAVSICFGSHAAGEQPTFLTSQGALQSPASTTNQQNDRGTYGHQFQWTDTSPSAGDAPVKMETDSLAGTGASSGASGHALSRTLLPIGQSRCIEYFQFL